MITPPYQNNNSEILSNQKRREFQGILAKSSDFFTCLVENRGVGVTTTLGPGEFICSKYYYLHTDHYLGRKFLSLGNNSLSRIFSKILHIDSVNPYHLG